ncbi:NAD(P)-dependent alcohol dehydrogenase [Deinococcus apachensis]|uniref:NAD(P)-dependent alcohol dehydrogenase n=1 Tax=Deinococcus apachensis TaxID=309886 RepID=UPI0003707112|nr:NAD(P)-dependent alcohol dehydrogenase [Deinococcus apachensis]
MTATTHSIRTMQAVVQNAYGPAEVLKLSTVNRAAVREDRVLLRVHAASAHIGDWHMMTGTPSLMRVLGFGLRAPTTRIRGTDVAGQVTEIGQHVTQFQVGDQVYGICDGAFAEYASADPARLAHKPANLTFEQAAAVPTSAATALHALRDAGQVQPGQRVLIIGAGGAVGTFAVQLAKAFGAHVTGVVSTSKLELVRSIGADEVIDYTRQDFTRLAARYDLILDIAGNRPLPKLRRVLTPTGTLVLVGGERGGRVLGGMDRTLRALALSPFSRQNLRGVMSTTSTQDLNDLRNLIEAGQLVPVITRTYRLDETADAIRAVAEGHGRGKVVISVYDGASTLPAQRLPSVHAPPGA